MFFKRGQKKNPEASSTGPAVSVSTIPEVFYGGNNPEPISANSQQNKSVPSKLIVPEANKTQTRLVATVMIFIFVSACAGAGWYYWNYLSSDSGALPAIIKTPVETSPPALVQKTEPEKNTSPTTTPDSENTLSTNEATLPPTSTKTLASFNDLVLEFPTLNQIDSSDFDADGLTDSEEEIYGTDPSIFDTDKDEYNDGQEVANLYNPKGQAPVRIADSGLVREYTAPNSSYRFYYPISWTIGAVDTAGTNILLTAANGDYIEVRQSDKKPGEDFNAWFGRNAGGEKITDLENGLNRFGTNFFKRKDDLVAYVDNTHSVLVLIYHPESSAPINFRHIMRMLLESLRVTGVSTSPNAE